MTGRNVGKTPAAPLEYFLTTALRFDSSYDRGEPALGRLRRRTDDQRL